MEVMEPLDLIGCVLHQFDPVRREGQFLLRLVVKIPHQSDQQHHQQCIHTKEAEQALAFRTQKRICSPVF